MKSHGNLLRRRRFLKTGIAGGALMALLPFWKLLSTPLSESSLKSSCKLSKDSPEKLLRITSKYGSEFAEIYVKREKELSCTETKSRTRRAGHARV